MLLCMRCNYEISLLDKEMSEVSVAWVPFECILVFTAKVGAKVRHTVSSFASFFSHFNCKADDLLTFAGS